MRALRLTVMAILMATLPGLQAASAQNRAPITDVNPGRTFIITGYVALPDGSPARRVLVKISSRAGMTRQMLTSDQGRFDFKEMPPGSYRLVSSSTIDPSLVSDVVETDTTRTATDLLNVNLFLRRSDSEIEARQPATISVAEAAQKIPKDARRAFNQAVRLRDERKFDEALSQFNRALSLYPEYFQALTERGDLYIARSQLAEAAADFESALKLNSEYGHALRGIGYCKLEKKEYTDAARYLEQSIKDEPNNFNAYLLLGIADLKLDQRDAARKALQQALKLNPAGAVRAHIHLANLNAREGSYKAAADELRTYLDQNPFEPDADRLRAIEAQWRAMQTAKASRQP